MTTVDVFNDGYHHGILDCHDTHRDMRKAWRHEVQRDLEIACGHAHAYGYQRGQRRGVTQALGAVFGLLVVARVLGRGRR
jgi:hypothetical protein